MFENLSDRLSRVVKTMRGQARLTEANTADMLREIRLALLEADVALPVIKDLLAKIKEKALGEEVASSLSPGQALVGLVKQELTDIMRGGDELHAGSAGNCSTCDRVAASTAALTYDTCRSASL